ncbi:MAG: uroporphyrinogen-III C-methyltransferase [Elusimicrobia bacterium]|nr:uroporphyrinogen-III C-methyltransferase [Elusimicrobiota bacterium]
MKGKVYLVGGGPGDAGLLTLKGAECLRAADCVVYDALANADLLAHAPEKAEKIYVGKRGAVHALEQDEINSLLVRLARRGGTVVRLKGGDPFIFGRGGEEARELSAAKIPFEIVPGVSSAVASPAYAGIPVTDRSFAPMVTFITGHRRDYSEGEKVTAMGKKDRAPDLPWASLASGGGTLVFLMGVSSLPLITEKLMAAGLSGATPAAIVSNGTTPRQVSISGRLSNIAELARKAGIKAPAVTVVGGVAGLRGKLAWFEKRPLFGKKIVVTRSREQAGALAQKLSALGAEVIIFPSIKIAPLKSFAALDREIMGLSGYNWVVFTSANGVDVFFARLKKLGLDARRFGAAKVAAIGPATAEALRLAGIEADVVPEKYVSEEILKTLGKVKAQKILLPRAAAARDALHAGLKSAGALVTEIPTYNTLPDRGNIAVLRRLLEAGAVSLVTFTSSSTVTGFLESFKGADKKLLKEAAIGSIGPITSATLKKLGFKPDFEARRYTLPGLVEAALEYFRKKVDRL